MSTAMITLNKEIIHRYTSMLNNKARNEFYYNALKKYAKNKVVIDVGTGTGILAAYALEHGAKFVYAVEGNRNSANMAQNVLGKCFDQSRFKVINTIFPCRQVKQRYQKDMLKDIIKTKSIDLYVGELIGEDLFDEDQVDIWDELNEYYFRDTVTAISPSANPNAPLSPKQLREIEALKTNDHPVSIPEKLSADIHIWNSEIEIPDRTGAYKLQELDIDAVLLPKFSDALLNFDKELNSPITFKFVSTEEEIKLLNKGSTTSYIPPYRKPRREDPRKIWGSHDSSVPEPDKIIVDVFGVTKDNVPDTISFSVVIEESGDHTIAINNKLSFEDTSLYLKDATSTWQRTCFFRVNIKGKYTFTRDLLNRTTWSMDHEYLPNKKKAKK
jgi:predicted RNA methylase